MNVGTIKQIIGPVVDVSFTGEKMCIRDSWMTDMINFLRVAFVLNSQRNIPCQVPKAGRPSMIGMLTVDPERTLLICAGISSGPSSWCCIPGKCSGASLSKNNSKSTLTAGSACSLMQMPAEVCCMNNWNTPWSGHWDTTLNTSFVIRWNPLLNGPTESV